MRILASLLVLSFCGSLFEPTTARADWLVLKSGVRIETRGAWQVKGRQVRFTTAKTRQLQALPLDEVDLAASRAATGPDPNRSAAQAVAEGGPVVLGVDPDLRGDRPAPQPLPRSIRDLAKLKLNPKAIEADKELFGAGGTLSEGTSLLMQLYERWESLRLLRRTAVARVGESEVQELESDFTSARQEIHRSCVEAGLNPEAGESSYCFAIVLEVTLESLLGAGPSGYNPEVDQPLEEAPPSAKEPKAEEDPPAPANPAPVKGAEFQFSERSGGRPSS